MASKPVSYYLSTTIEPAATALQSLEANYGSYFQGFTLEEKKFLLALITVSLSSKHFVINYRQTPEVEAFVKRLAVAIKDVRVLIVKGYGYSLAEFLLEKIRGN